MNHNDPMPCAVQFDGMLGFVSTKLVKLDWDFSWSTLRLGSFRACCCLHLHSYLTIGSIACKFLLVDIVT